MLIINTRQMKVKDLYEWHIKSLFGYHGRINDICGVEVNDNGDVIFTASETTTAFLHNVDGVNKDFYGELERLEASPSAKIFVKSKDRIGSDKLYPLIDFLVDKEQSDPHEVAYCAVRVVVRE